jgi:hypothetical protein
LVDALDAHFTPSHGNGRAEGISLDSEDSAHHTYGAFVGGHLHIETGPWLDRYVDDARCPSDAGGTFGSSQLSSAVGRDNHARRDLDRRTLACREGGGDGLRFAEAWKCDHSSSSSSEHAGTKEHATGKAGPTGSTLGLDCTDAGAQSGEVNRGGLGLFSEDSKKGINRHQSPH